MPRIFISYRRDDGSATSELLYHRLSAHFSAGHVFIDVQDIPAGADWRNLLSKRLKGHGIVLVMIAPSWLDTLNKRMAAGVDDYVRWEVAEAFRQKKRVIPVLIDDAQLPSAGDLPLDIAELASLQSMRIGRDTRDRDMTAIIAEVQERKIIDFFDLVRLRRLLGTAGFVTLIVAGAAICSFAWVSLFDLASLDTRTANWTMLVGDLVFEPALSPDLLIVAITPDATESGRLSLARRAEYAQLITMATAQKARAIVFDITPQEPGPNDAVLIDAVRAAQAGGTRVVFGFKALGPDNQPVVIAGLREAGAYIGLTCVGQKLGEVVFGTAAMQLDKGPVHGSLALYAITGATSIDPIHPADKALNVRVGQDDRSIPFSVREVAERLDEGCEARPLKAVMARIFMPLSPREAWRDANRRLDERSLIQKPALAPDAWRDKVIVVGEEGERDLLQTRLDPEKPSRYGVEFQAQTINALMTGKIAAPVTIYVQWFVVLLMISWAILYRIARVGKSRMPDLFVLAATCIVFMAAMVVLYSKAGMLFDSLYDLVGFVGVWWILSVCEKRWSHERR